MAAFVVLRGFSVDSFRSMSVRCDDIEKELRELALKWKKKWRFLYNSYSATEKSAALETICDKLEKVEEDIRHMIPVAEVKVQNSAMLEVMASLLEAASSIIPGAENVQEHRQFLSKMRKAYGTQVLSSEMIRMITGTGSTGYSISGPGYHAIVYVILLWYQGEERLREVKRILR